MTASCAAWRAGAAGVDAALRQLAARPGEAAGRNSRFATVVIAGRLSEKCGMG